VPQKVVLVAGSRKIQSNYDKIANLAETIGAQMMHVENWILLNGGASETSSVGIISVDHLVCSAAEEELKLKKYPNQQVEARIVTLLPEKSDQKFHHIGNVEISKGTNPYFRRFELVKKADAVITIEGVTGTEDIIERAMKSKRPVLPIACTGGKSKTAWENHEKDILQIFGIKKASEEYEMLTTIKGLDNPEKLSELVIRMIRNRLARSLYPTRPHADNPSEKDLLGRKPFAKIIADSIRDHINDTGKDKDDKEDKTIRAGAGSFLVHIYGPWGSGKSTLLGFVEEYLKDEQKLAATGKSPKPGWIVVWYNAWQNQRIDPPWWLLMDTVYKEILQQTSLGLSLKIRIKENMWRLWNGWSRVFWLAALSSAVIAAAIFSGAVSLGSIQTAAQSGGMELLAFFSDRIVGGIMATIVSVITGLRAFGNSLLPASPNAASQFTRKIDDPMEKLRQHFQDMIGWTGKPVAIFIDDLDRCRDEYIVQFIEGIQTIFRGSADLAFVVAADRRWLYSSYQKAFGSFSDPIEDLGRPLGYLFLEKTFDISIPMPKLSDHYRDVYLNYLVTGDEEGLAEIKERAKSESEKLVETMTDSEIGHMLKSTSGSAIEDQTFREAVIERRFTQPEFKEKTENFLKDFSRFMDPTPRSMKRLVAAFGAWQARNILSGNSIDDDCLAEWVIIYQRWPMMANFLEQHPEVVDAIKRKNRKDWNKILQKKGVEEHIRNMLSNSIVGDVVSGKDVGTPLDSDTIRKLVSQSW
jgi:KAP family P-loop domain/SLOG cluster4 family